MKIARRFLLAPSLARLIAMDRYVGRQIIEGYLSVQPGNHQFVRLQADEFQLVLPLIGPDGDLVEDLAPLPRMHAEALFGLCIGQISYDQYQILVQGASGSRALLDRVIYPVRCDIISVEFDDQKQAEAFEVPTWFGSEVTGEYTHDRRYIALNGLPANPEVPVSNTQLEAVLDMLEHAKQAAEANGKSAANEVIAALSRSLETSGVLKSPSEAKVPIHAASAAEQVREAALKVAR